VKVSELIALLEAEEPDDDVKVSIDDWADKDVSYVNSSATAGIVTINIY